MNRNHSSGDFEKDPVWDLLRETSTRRPSPNFADNVVRAARLEAQAKPWWRTFLIPASVGVALTGATALVITVISFQSGTPVPEPPQGAKDLAALQDTVETEVFLAATEHLENYSNEELVSLIGF